MAIPIDQLPIGEGRHPDGTTGASFFMDRPTLEVIEADGPEWKFEEARFIAEAIKEPDVIFQGLHRDTFPDGLCYSVRFTADPDEPDAGTPPAFGRVFVVFARLGVGGHVVFDWSWRSEDPDEPGHPVSWQTDFTRRTWHKP